MAPVPACRRSRPSQALPSLRCSVSSAPKTVPRKVHPRNLSGSRCKGHLVRVAKYTTSCRIRSGSSRLFEGCQRWLFQGSHCNTLELWLPVHLHPSSRTSRQTRQLLAKVMSSQCSSHPGSRVAFLTVDFVSGTFHRYSFQLPDAPGEVPAVVRFHKSMGDTPPGPCPSAAPARSEARCLVVANGNHVRVGTLEALPV